MNQRLELTAIRKNKEEFPIELTVTAIEDESESYYSAFIRDIGSRRQREQELVQMKEKAEQAAKAGMTLSEWPHGSKGRHKRRHNQASNLSPDG